MPESRCARASAWRNRSAPPTSPPGLQDSYLGHSPVIALTGHKEPSFQHRNSYQEIAHAPLFAAVTKFSTPVYSTGELPRLLRHAWRAALADPVRPTHLDFNGLQGDVIELGQTDAPVEIETEARAIPVHRPVADERDIERAAKILLARRRLAIVAGDGAAASGAGPEILALAEALGRADRHDARRARHHPDPASPLGRGRRQLFGAARQPHRPQRRYGAVHRLRYRRPGDAQLADPADRHEDRADRGRSDWSSAVPTRTRPALSAIRRRPWPGLSRLSASRRATAVLPTRRRGSSPIGARAWRRSSTKNTAPIAVERLCAEITKALPPDGVLVADTGYSGIWTGTMIDLNGAGQTYLRAAGSLGWAFPASLGAQCAAGNAQGRLLHRRWRVLLSPRRVGVGAALPDPGGHRHQQQFRLRPEPDRRAPHFGQPAGPRRGADPLRPDRFHRGCRAALACAASGSSSRATSRRRLPRRSPPTSRSSSMS